MSALTLHLQAVGLLGPGLPGWETSRQMLAGQAPYTPAATVVPPPARLPPAERRRAGGAIKVALAAADEACRLGGLEAGTLASVFTSSSGDGTNCHALCEALAGADRLVSPTRFTNSVHNAAAGYWHIAVGSQAPSTSLCAYDGSWGAGLIEAATQAHAGQRAVLLVASDAPYPEPLHRTRPLPDSFGVALVLSPQPGPTDLARLTLALCAPDAAPPSRCELAALEALRGAIPAAQALPLLVALARGETAELCFEARRAVGLQLRLEPLGAAAGAMPVGATTEPVA